MATIYDCSDSTELLTGMRLARAALGRGELVVLPTDTVYGVAADAFNPDAVQRLLTAKGRTRQAPPPVLIPGIPTLDALAAEVPEKVRALVAAFWPGGLTVILPARDSLEWDLGETHGTVALRMPDNTIALEILSETGPLAVSSANLTGSPAARTAQEALCHARRLRERVPRRGSGRRRSGRRTRLRLHDRRRDRAADSGRRYPHRPARRHLGRGHPGGHRVIFYVLVTVISALVTFGLSLLIWKLSTKFRLYPAIRARDVHTTPTPRLGGVAMFLGILVAFAVASPISWFRLVFVNPGQIYAILGAALHHRADRRRRRHLGPRLGDQARRADHRRRPAGLAGRSAPVAPDRRHHGRQSPTCRSCSRCSPSCS